MVYVSGSNVLENRSIWRLSIFSDVFWGMVNFVILFFHTMFSLMVSITKFSILIGSAHTYLSHNWRAITWVSNYSLDSQSMVTHMQVLSIVQEEGLQDRLVEGLEELVGEEVVHLTTRGLPWVDEEGKRLSS
ncbi:hypothetical protein ACROYT_G023713 [Oculina patagonica]